MSKKDFRLVRPVKDAYSTREVGYEDTFDYPNLYNEKTGEVGICGGHGIYAWAKREDYELINQTKMSKELTSVEKWVMKYMNYSLEDIKLNRKLLQEELNNKNKDE